MSIFIIGCEFDGITCEWKYKTIDWSCEAGFAPRARAFWGREKGDKETCSDGVPKVYLQNDDCPGNDLDAAIAVLNW